MAEAVVGRERKTVGLGVFALIYWRVKMIKSIYKNSNAANLGVVRVRALSYALVFMMLFSATGAHGSSLAGEDGMEMEDGCSMSASDLAAARAYLRFRDIKSAHIPKGVPEIYGKELSVSFDNVQDAINKLRILGPTYGNKKIVLEGDDLERYVSIGSKIACQYCCGAKTLVKPDGVAACGCAHSIMMRGLTAYLIKAHPEVSDDRILEELKVWKRTFFPKPTLMAKLLTMKNQGDKGVDEIINEFPDFLPKMVGGC